MSSVQFTPRRSEERSVGDLGWLRGLQTFSVSPFQKTHLRYGPLRMLNEDRVSANTGFGKHPHSEFEIFSYVVSGELEHKDSMGNIEILRRGDLQLTSAGTGITHSEKAHGPTEVHFLQIWSFPRVARLKPHYYTRHFSEAEKTDKWAKIVAPARSEGVSEDREGEGPAPVETDLTLYATILTEGSSLTLPLEGKKSYVHLIQTSGYNTGGAGGASVRVHDGKGSEVVIREGDGTYVQASDSGAILEFENVGDRPAEFIAFDMD